MNLFSFVQEKLTLQVTQSSHTSAMEVQVLVIILHCEKKDNINREICHLKKTITGRIYSTTKSCVCRWEERSLSSNNVLGEQWGVRCHGCGHERAMFLCPHFLLVEDQTSQLKPLYSLWWTHQGPVFCFLIEGWDTHHYPPADDQGSLFVTQEDHCCSFCLHLSSQMILMCFWSCCWML